MSNLRIKIDGDMEPGNRQSAPGSLALVQDFVNTKDLLEQREILASPDLLRSWLGEHRLLDTSSVSEEDLAWVWKVREALRAWLHANNGATLDAGTLETLNYAAKNAQLVIRFHQDGQACLEPDASGLDGALGHLLTQVFTAMQNGTWSRLKACRNDACQWIFYDTSKNRSGAWCTMTICGNRIKARSYRQRHQAHEI